MEEAITFRNKFFKLYSGLPRWHDRQRDIVRMYGQVRTPIGRIRHLPEIFSPDDDLRASAERQSINTPVQSFASDICVASLIEITKDPTMTPDKVKVVGSVHDSLLFEVKNEYLESITTRIKQIMEQPKIIVEKFGINFRVPIVAELAVKPNGWGSIE